MESGNGFQEANSLDMKRPIAIRALRRSNVRKKIAEFLFDISPSCSYTSDIAYNIKTTPTNVIGAIRGMGSRYKEEESLIGLEMVEEKSCGKNIRLYGLTDFGKDVIKELRKR
jgi:predicted transcriptional regulator with HTH domain